MQISYIRMLIELKELGEKDAAAIPSILESKERIQTGHMADSEGVYLERLVYKPTPCF